MLNETKEFADYTTHLIIDQNEIRTLVEITRENKLNRIERARRALETWCSSTKVNEADYPELIGRHQNGRFYDYMQDAFLAFQNLLSRIDRKEIVRTDKQIVNYKKTMTGIDHAMKYWSKTYAPKTLGIDFYSGVGKQAKYNNKSFSFDVVLANALHDGPLRNRFVKVSYDIVDDLVAIHQKKYAAHVIDFLMLSALYVLQRHDNEHTYQPINLKVISNWRRKKTFVNRYKEIQSALARRDMFAEDFIDRVTKKIIIADDLLKYFEVVDDLNIDRERYFLISDDQDPNRLRKDIKSRYDLVFKQNHPSG